MDVLITHKCDPLGKQLARMVGHDARVGRSDLAADGGQLAEALRRHPYDVHLVGASSLPDWKSLTGVPESRVFVPVRRLLVDESPCAISALHALWLGFDGVVDLGLVSGSLIDSFLGPVLNPLAGLVISDTGAPLAAVCHDATDARILDGIVDGLTDSEIAEGLHYAVQSIRNRVSRILAVSGARNRTHLASLFLQNGGVS